MMPTKAFAILGPTAGGKTRLALDLAEILPIEIISLDSALVYKGMDIGTAKPNAAERAAVPHHLIDIIDPSQSYSAAQFVNDAIRLCHDIHRRGNLPLIVGGTMMYYHALTGGMNTLPEADPAVRAAIQAEKQQHGNQYLYEILQQCDPETAARLNVSDSQRIERALEVYRITGKPMSVLLAETPKTSAALNLYTVALIPENRATLHQQIATRFHTMLEQGFLDEVRRLRRQFPELTLDYPAMRCVGYRQAWNHLDGETDYPTFVEQGIAATRQLAKRQLTWLRKLGADQTFDPFTASNLAVPTAKLIRQHFQ